MLLIQADAEYRRWHANDFPYADFSLTCVLYLLQWGYTALMIAAYKGHSDVLSALIAAGADTDLADEVGISPMCFLNAQCDAELCCLVLNTEVGTFLFCIFIVW